MSGVRLVDDLVGVDHGIEDAAHPVLAAELLDTGDIVSVGFGLGAGTATVCLGFGGRTEGVCRERGVDGIWVGRSFRLLGEDMRHWSVVGARQGCSGDATLIVPCGDASIIQ